MNAWTRIADAEGIDEAAFELLVAEAVETAQESLRAWLVSEQASDDQIDRALLKAAIKIRQFMRAQVESARRRLLH